MSEKKKVSVRKRTTKTKKPSKKRIAELVKEIEAI